MYVITVLCVREVGHYCFYLSITLLHLIPVKDTEMEDIVVRRFAIKYNPPTLVVEYKNKNSLFLKKIKIKSRNEAVRYQMKRIHVLTYF